MSEYNKTILTSAGLSLVAKVNKGNTKFTITKAATSAEKLVEKSITELQELTELPSVMQYGIINDASDSVQDNIPVIGAELVFNNKDLMNSYNINTVGLYAKEEGSAKEILYAISTATTPEVMPDYKSKTLFKFSMTMFVVIGKTENVSVNVTEKGVVTQTQLDKLLETLVTKVELKDELKNTGQVKSVNEFFPDYKGNVKLPNFENPNYRYIKGQTLNVDMVASPGIYALSDATVTSSINIKALDSVPGGATKTGYMVVLYHDSKNIDQILLINADKSTTDFVIATRSITSDGSSRPSFKRLLNTDDFNNLWNKIMVVENKELVHHCDDLATGIEYSKANPNVLVATP